METRFFAPGSLVSNLDFVESIFGNGGDPQLPENDAGHIGCVILAPHLVGLKKKDLRLPHASQATPCQIRDGMSWETEDELYNGGSAFKICCRDHYGPIAFATYILRKVSLELALSLLGDRPSLPDRLLSS